MAIARVLAAFAAQAASAFLLKTASSIDDVLWLAKFLTADRSRAQRLRNVLLYAAVCLVQTTLAFLIARSGEEALDAFVHIRGWSSDRLLTCLAAAGLGLYSIKLLLEELCERFADENEDASACELCRRCCRGHTFAPLPVDEDKAVDDRGGDEDLGVELTEAAAAEAAEPADALEDVDLEKQETAKTETLEDEADDGSARTLFVVAFCGSLDDLTLFVPMLAGGAVGPAPLVVGACLAAAFVVAICLFLTFFQKISDVLQAIPLVAITTCFFVYLVVKAALGV